MSIFLEETLTMPFDKRRIGNPLIRKLILAFIVSVLALALITQVAGYWIESRTPRDGKLLMIDGTSLHYLDRGVGSPIVLIHGLSGQMRNFAPELVNKLAANHRVILIDRPGSGYSAPLAGRPNTLNGQADVVAGLITALGLEAPLVVGHSLGGAVALNLALNHPDTVGALALIAPVTQQQESVPSAFSAMNIRSDGLRRFLSLTFATPLGLLIFNPSAQSVFAPESLPADFAITGGGLLSIRPQSYFSAGGDLFALRDALPDMVARYPLLQMPIGILFGRNDKALDPTQHGVSLRDAVPGATLTQMDGGHMIVFTAPDPVSDWILDQANEFEQAAQHD
jgi:pimeloyl-ACP methyl ester carboxylesterase